MVVRVWRENWGLKNLIIGYRVYRGVSMGVYKILF